ncbi:MAG: hypothetical protein KFH98_01540 [Gemmatimonadetes bacterium]|nr:hypothetical protein [Gemmatimonadota bacterium]
MSKRAALLAAVVGTAVVATLVVMHLSTYSESPAPSSQLGDDVRAGPTVDRAVESNAAVRSKVAEKSGSESVLSTASSTAEICRADPDSAACHSALGELFGGLPAASGGLVGGIPAPSYAEVFSDIPGKVQRVRAASDRAECVVAADTYMNAGDACAARDMLELAMAGSTCGAWRMDNRLYAEVLRQKALAAQTQEEYARRMALIDWEILRRQWIADQCKAAEAFVADVRPNELFARAAQVGDPYAATGFAGASLALINEQWSMNAPTGELDPAAVPVIDRMYADTKAVLRKMATSDPVSAHAQLAWFIAEREPRVSGEFISESERVARQRESMKHLIVAESLDTSGRVDGPALRELIVGRAPDLPPNDMSLAVYEAGLILDELKN